MDRRESLWVLRRCGRRGHQVVWLDDSLADRMTGEESDGTTLLRCLRCGTFLRPAANSVAAVEGTQGRPISLAQVPLVVRGAHGRKLALLRVLAVERGVRALGLLLGAIVIFALNANRDTVIAKTDAVIASAGPLAKQIGWDISHSHTLELVHKGLGSSPTAYTLVGIGLVLYAIVQIVEAVGLWAGRRWAEYLAAVATACFLPLEIYEMLSHPTVFKALTITVNVLIVVYIVFKGRLFGVRGGHARYLAEIRAATLLGEMLQDSGRSPEEQSGHVLV